MSNEQFVNERIDSMGRVKSTDKPFRNTRIQYFGLTKIETYKSMPMPTTQMSRW